MDQTRSELILSNLPQTSVILFNEQLEVTRVFDHDRIIMEALGISSLPNNLEELKGDEPGNQVFLLCELALEGIRAYESLKGNSGYFLARTGAIGENSEPVTGILMIQDRRGLVSDERMKLEKGKEKAEESSEIKTRFMASISHEIRTPLNAIIGFIEQLQKTSLNEVQEEYVKIIDKSSVYLLDLVNEILTYSKLESGEIQLDEEDFNLEGLVAEIFSTLKMRADKKAINFTYQLDEPLKKIFRGDGFRLKQVLMNLLSNAIKFTEYGYVELRGCVTKSAGRQVWCRFEVIDTGIGIPEAKLADIFREYRQASSGITRKHGGTGLGLTISRRLTRLMGGRIGVESTEGKGSVFTVDIPLQKSELRKLSQDIRSISTDSLSGKRALVVDDDAMNRNLGQIILEGFHMEVELASGGAEAIEMIDRQKYDIILLDIHMPEVSGLEVARHIQSSNKNRDTRILIVTAEMNREELDKYRAEGMNDFLIKPYREVHLYNKLLKILLDEPEPLDEEPRKIILKQYNSDTLYDLTELRSVTRENPYFFNEMIQTFISNATTGMKEIQEAYHQQRWEDLRETAHRLIPSYKHLKINKVVSDLVELKERASEGDSQEQLKEVITRIRKSTDEVVKHLKSETI